LFKASKLKCYLHKFDKKHKTQVKQSNSLNCITASKKVVMRTIRDSTVPANGFERVDINDLKSMNPIGLCFFGYKYGACVFLRRGLNGIPGCMIYLNKEQSELIETGSNFF
jgi:hypothetical protein